MLVDTYKKGFYGYCIHYTIHRADFVVIGASLFAKDLLFSWSRKPILCSLWLRTSSPNAGGAMLIL